MTLRLVKTTDAGFKSLLKNILARRGTREGKVERRVAEIVTAVQKQGDRALLRYTRLFDRLRLTAAALEVKPAEIEGATARVAPSDLATLPFAAKRAAPVHPRHLHKNCHVRAP